MCPTRTLALASIVAGLCGCGGFESHPLTHAVLRGSLVGAGPSSMATILGKPELVDVPTASELAVLSGQTNANWAFELNDVPSGPIELLLFISGQRADRLKMDIEGGEVEELTPQVGQRISTLRVDLEAPSHQLIRRGTVRVLGTPIKRSIELSEMYLAVPAGCYALEASVPGLGTKTVTESCVAPGLSKSVPIYFDEPDGSPGREGCSVTKCDYDYECKKGGECEEDD